MLTASLAAVDTICSPEKGSDMAPVILLLTASLTGAAITLALLWPCYPAIAIMSAPLASGLLMAAVATILWLGGSYPPQPDKGVLSLTERPKPCTPRAG